jgi:hypothetical protein
MFQLFIRNIFILLKVLVHTYNAKTSPRFKVEQKNIRLMSNKPRKIAFEQSAFDRVEPTLRQQNKVAFLNNVLVLFTWPTSRQTTRRFQM